MRTGVARSEIVAAVREGGPFPGADIVEVPLLLPHGQAAALEGAAWQRGLTTGQLVRQIIRGFLDPFEELHILE